MNIADNGISPSIAGSSSGVPAVQSPAPVAVPTVPVVSQVQAVAPSAPAVQPVDRAALAAQGLEQLKELADPGAPVDPDVLQQAIANLSKPRVSPLPGQVAREQAITEAAAQNDPLSQAFESFQRLFAPLQELMEYMFGVQRVAMEKAEKVFADHMGLHKKDVSTRLATALEETAALVRSEGAATQQAISTAAQTTPAVQSQVVLPQVQALALAPNAASN